MFLQWMLHAELPNHGSTVAAMRKMQMAMPMKVLSDKLQDFENKWCKMSDESLQDFRSSPCMQVGSISVV